MSNDTVPKHELIKIKYNLVRVKQDEALTHLLKRCYF